MFGFESAKDILDVFPVSVAGCLVVLVWSLDQALDKRPCFERLIARGVAEVEP